MKTNENTMNVPDGIIFKKNEIPLMTCEDVVFSQTQTKSVRAFAYGKGLGVSAPIKRECMVDKCSGQLVLTTKRLMFIGINNKSINLDKINSVETDILTKGVLFREKIGCIVLTTSNTARAYRFTVNNSMVWKESILNAIRNNENNSWNWGE